jgi:hypothetical protein
MFFFHLTEGTGALLAGLLVLLAAVDNARRERLAIQRLPELTDEEFLARFSVRHTASAEQVFKARRLVSRMFGLPEGKLDPDFNTWELARRLAGKGGMMFGDWMDELMENAEATGTPVPESVETIGDIVFSLIDLDALGLPE